MTPHVFVRCDHLDDVDGVTAPACPHNASRLCHYIEGPGELPCFKVEDGHVTREEATRLIDAVKKAGVLGRFPGMPVDGKRHGAAVILAACAIGLAFILGTAIVLDTQDAKRKAKSTARRVAGVGVMQSGALLAIDTSSSAMCRLPWSDMDRAESIVRPGRVLVCAWEPMVLEVPEIPTPEPVWLSGGEVKR